MAIVTIGEQIKLFRVEKGLTQKQLADACGMADSAIRKYESGNVRPKMATVSRIAKALGVEPLELTLHDPNYPITFTVSIDELPGAIHNMFSGNAEKNKPAPVSEDGLDGQDRQLMDLMKKLSADQKQFLLAQLLTLTGQESNLLKSIPTDDSQLFPVSQEGIDTAPAADGPGTPPEGSQEGK